jgi:gliding motility-associated-like protein
MKLFELKLKSKPIIFGLLFSILSIGAQVSNNMVYNPSFEKKYQCPQGIGQLGQISSCENWYRVDYISSPDYFNSCATNSLLGVPNNYYGKQIPRTGNAYIGFFLFDNTLEFREHVAVEILKLKPQKQYCVTFYISLAEKSRIATSNIGVYFNQDSIKTYYPIPNPLNTFLFTTPYLENSLIAKDTLNWQKIQFNYLASGNEKHISIGNFRRNVNTNIEIIKPLIGVINEDAAYYYLDDVSVIEINPAKAAQQKTISICPSSTYTLGTDSTEDATYQWQPTVGLSCVYCPNPIITASNSIKYYLTKQQCSATTIDSVYINVITGTNTANAGTKQLICVNDQVQLGINDANSFTTYTWQPINHLSCFNCPQPIAQPFSTITYTLNKQECAITTTSTVEVLVDNCKLQLPQAFSPNGDGINEQLIITIPFAQSAKLTVFNRWGSELYSTSSNEQGSQAERSRSLTWDGKAHKGLLLPHGETGEGLLPSGTYYYLVEVTQLDGTKKVYKEFVVLVR